MTNHVIRDFTGFVKKTESLGEDSNLILFRGQAHRGGLLPGIARNDPRSNTTTDEKKVLEQLLLQGASLLNGVGPTQLDALVLAQHFGLKTRLLDWTSNPLAALWFACSDYRKGDAFVYVLEADTFLEKDVYSKDPFSPAKTKVFQARLNNNRIIAQDGWFTLHRFSKSAKRFVPLEENTDIKTKIHRIRVPEEARESILQSLERHGMSARTLFPDLSGLCQYLNYKYGLF